MRSDKSLMTRNIKPFRRWYLMPASILFMGILSTAMLVWINDIKEKQGNIFILDDAIQDIQILTATSHLWLEEGIFGDPDVDIHRVLADFNEAVVLSGNVLRGGPSRHGVILPPLDDPALRTQASALESLLMELRRIALERLGNPETSGIGTPIDQRFDHVFAQFQKQAVSLNRSVEAKWSSNNLRSKHLFLGVLLIWTTMVVVAATGIWLRERQHKQADEALQDARDDLERQVEDRTGELTAANVLLRAEIVERERADIALRESGILFRSLVEDLPAGIMIVQDGRIVFQNPAQKKLLGSKDHGDDFRNLGDVHPDDRPRFDRLCEAIASRIRSRQEMELRFIPQGEGTTGDPIICVHCQASPIDYRGNPSMLVNMVDITNVKDLERMVTLREKLASLGQLAAGIAHEIRNPLSSIDVNVTTLGHLCRQAEGLDQETRENIDTTIAQAKIASGRIAMVIRKVMDFSKPVPPRFDRINVNDAVEDAVAFSSATLKKQKVELRKTLAADLPGCRADRHLLEQVLINLITNALQAMASGGEGGELEIRSSLEDDSIVITVSDSGPGVPAKVRSRIFDPFYTTRKDGHGIGLSFSHQVISDHGGFLRVGTSRWAGAEFRIELPLELVDVPA